MENRRLMSILLVVMTGMVLCGPGLQGQAPQSQILGTVGDSSGAAVPGATVILRNEGTGIQTTVTTTNTGDYTFVGLDSGSYTVTVQRAGFATGVYPGIKVEVLQKKRVDVQLKLGELTTSVEVKGAEAKVDTDSAAVGTIVSRREVTDLPLNGREFDQLAQLMPGVQAVGITGQGGITAGASFALALRVGSGLEYSSINYTYDGVDNTFTYVSGAAMNPSIDSIQDFRIDRSQFPAEFGRGSSQIQVITRTGTNQFHGTVWEYLRNTKTSAGNYYTHQKEDLKRNQYGANIGGPIRKDKAFFFFNWEGQKLRSVDRKQGTVFTPKQRMGDLSEFLPATIHDPFTGVAFPGNIIPPDQINPVSKSLMDAYMPPPNLPGLSGNYLSNFREIDDWNQYIGRVDYNLSERDRVDFRFSGQPRYSLTPGLTSFSEPTFLDTYYYNINANWTHSFTSNTVTEVRFGWHKEHILQNSVPRSQFADPNIEGVGNNVPIIFPIAPFSTGMVAWNFPANYYMKSYDFVANTTHIRGSHTVKFGFERRTHGWTRPTGPGPEHVWEQFNGAFTDNGVADYLLGYPYTATTTNPIHIPMGNKGDPVTDAFIQDDWKVSPRLTLNLGLRYDLFARRRSMNDILSAFDPATGKIVVGGSSINEAYFNLPLLAANPDLFVMATEVGWPKDTLMFGNHKNFSPRIGFAFRPWKDNKTVIRGGYGLFYMGPFENAHAWGTGTYAMGYGAGYQNVANTTPPTLSIQNPFAAGPGVVPPPGGNTVDPYVKDSYTQQISLGIQRELPWGMVGEASFQDQHSIRLHSQVNWNQSRLGTREFPYPRYGAGITAAVDDGHSRYRALELLLRKSSQHYTFQFSYVWAKNLARYSPTDVYQRDLFYGPDYYVPTEAKVNWVVDLPVGKGRKFLNHGGIANAIIGGWTTSGFFILHQGGAPLTITSTEVPIVSVANENQRPDRICSGRIDSPTVDRWFDTSCFVVADPNTWGNSGTGILFGPSRNMIGDFGLFKNFAIREETKLQFRWEMFNVFNHPLLNNPDTTLGSPSFGQIIGKSQTSRVMQFALRLSF